MHNLTTRCAIVLIACAFVVHTSSNAVAQETPLENTQPLSSPLIAPAEAVKMLNLPAGFNATLFAAEPEIKQPISITTDAKGRIWVAECITYAESKRNFDLRYNDRILIFEDTDQDGVADKRTVFWEGGKKLTSIEVGHGGVWVTAAPNFFFIPDANGDDVPDSEPVIMLDGWNDDFVRHNMVNGLKWGPDGWLYGRHGIQATSLVGPPGSTDSQRTSLNCCMWRFHPVTHDFEVVCEGTTNPWGHDWDQHGELFMINTVIGHLWHVVPGARYRRMYGAHFNPYTYEVIEQTADHFHFASDEKWWDVKRHGISDETDELGGGHAHCGMMIYQGDNWPETYRHKLFTANFHGRRLNQETLKRVGNGYVGTHDADFMNSEDLWFRGIEMIYGPDGGVYLLDWSDIGECHESDGVHRTSGRIYKLAYGTPKKAAVNLSSKSDAELVSYLTHPNQWFARTSRRLIYERAIADPGRRESIAHLLHSLQVSNETDINAQLQWMWATHVVQGTNARSALMPMLDFPNEHVQSTAIKLLTDQPSTVLAADLFEELNAKANDAETSPLVRLYLASSMRRMDSSQRMKMGASLTQYPQDSDDRTQPKLIWYSLEPAVVDNWKSAIELGLASKIPHISRSIFRRLSSASQQNPEILEALLTATWTKEDENFSDQDKSLELLNAIRMGLSGIQKVKQPANWESMQGKFLGAKNRAELKNEVALLGALFGDGLSLKQLRSIAVRNTNDTQVRRNAIKAYAEAQPDELFETLKRLLGDRAVALQVVRSMALCPDPDVATEILKRRKQFDTETMRSAIATLCTRPTWAQRLLNQIGEGQIEKSWLSASHARIIKSHGEASLDEMLAEHWGLVSDTPEAQQETIERIRTLVNRTDIAPDMSNGARLFLENCAACHVLHGQGGNRGPDLTGADRKNLNYLLENIVSPSSSVADTYRSSVLLMKDGRTLVGVVSEETDTVLKLLTAEEVMNVEVEQIEARRSTRESLMPNGLLDKMSEQEIVDLFGFLGK